MNELTDKQLDNLMAMLAAGTALDETTGNDISSSPQLWWNVQRNIAVGKDREHSPLQPPKAWWRTIGFVGVPLLLALLIVAGIFVSRDSVEAPALVIQTYLEQPMSSLMPSEESNKVEPKNVVASEMNIKSTDPSSRPLIRQTRVSSRKMNTTRTSSAPMTEEIKSEFVALNYSANPESGQVVRVKVPSSMMVNLGLVEYVAKPSSLVDAEVLVGDDGQTHAIRFIRQSAN